ncbi:MAG: hypothetical protein QXR27_03395 [Archaeoglobaceae archaeon]
MIPSGIEVLDSQIGGFHEGLIILYEESGAGGKEFALSFLLNNSGKFPLNYIAISKTVEEVRREIELSFPELKKRVEMNIVSLAEYYFKDSIVPMKWISDTSYLKILKDEKNILSKLVEVFDGLEGIVFLDSLTDLARVVKKMGWNAIIDILKGFKSVCIKRKVLFLTLLTAKVLERGLEEELFEVSDGVIVFEFLVERDTITKWMYFRKMLGVVPILERDRIVKYSIKIDPAKGFTISKIIRVL